MSTLSHAEPTEAAIPDGAEVADAMADFASTFRRWTRALVGDALSYSRMRLLCELHDVGPRRMADLASALDVTPRNVTTLVDGLERDGFVRRRPHPTDRRATVIELTDSAHGAVYRSKEHQAAIGHLFETLAPADRATLIRLIGDLESRMRPDAGLTAPEAGTK
ncbi:MAG: MarR family transcriptional regulator [Chloroflexota bacterium]|nr:MarR family transcriptional regulator [Chloroflexota bacterium]